MNKCELIKQHLSTLSLHELLRYRLKLCTSETNEDIELDISDLFKYPTRLETSYFDNWNKDLLKSLFHKLEDNDVDINAENNQGIDDYVSHESGLHKTGFHAIGLNNRDFNEGVTVTQLDEKITNLLSQKVFSDKDKRTLDMFDNFLASTNSHKVTMIHSSFHRKIEHL
ncbi:MAG: hypothetical protein ACI8VC_001494 [Candidatus Endobugula sp.]|jgi:hypothetical protein